MSDSQKRGRNEDDDEDDDAESGVDDAGSFMASKFRNAMDNAANEFICPITQELPVEPVTAMDGKVYERKAIEEWLARGNGKSPMTNQPMGSTLLPAIHVRNSLELMVRSGALTGDKVEAWKNRLDEIGKLESLRERAQGGDAAAMTALGSLYLHGIGGANKNPVEAVSWLKRGVEGGNADARGLLGHCYIHGIGVEPEAEEPHGYMLLTEAAMSDSPYACWRLGRLFQKGAQRGGTVVLRPNDALAAKWYRKMTECSDVWRPFLLKDREKEKALTWLHRYDETSTPVVEEVN